MGRKALEIIPDAFVHDMIFLRMSSELFQNSTKTNCGNGQRLLGMISDEEFG
jgi:hypothetical protein